MPNLKIMFCLILKLHLTWNLPGAVDMIMFKLKELLLVLVQDVK